VLSGRLLSKVEAVELSPVHTSAALEREREVGFCYFSQYYKPLQMLTVSMMGRELPRLDQYRSLN